MSDSMVELNIQNAVALVTINNAASHNALNAKVINGLIATLKTVAANSDVRAVVLTGAGNKAFSVGLDLKEFAGSNGVFVGGGERSLGIDSPMMRAFSEMPQPVIGAVNGYAITGGFEVALACDFLVCSDNAQFADTHALVGLLPGWGLSQRLPKLIGLNRALEMSFTGRYVDAQEAHRIGLVNHVYPAATLVQEAIQIAERIAITDPIALPKIKKMMVEGAHMSLTEGLRMEGEVASIYNDAMDLSYLEKRLQTLRELAKK
jgi:enoyl-CoA hydratase